MGSSTPGRDHRAGRSFCGQGDGGWDVQSTSHTYTYGDVVPHSHGDSHPHFLAHSYTCLHAYLYTYQGTEPDSDTDAAITAYTDLAG